MHPKNCKLWNGDFIGKIRFVVTMEDEIDYEKKSKSLASFGILDNQTF